MRIWTWPTGGEIPLSLLSKCLAISVAVCIHLGTNFISLFSFIYSLMVKILPFQKFETKQNVRVKKLKVN